MSPDGPADPGPPRRTPRRLYELPPFAPGTIALVRRSCGDLPDRTELLAEEFYRCLFELAPDARAMFPDDMGPQQERLLTALLAAVEALDDPAVLEPRLRAWGAWHRRVLGVDDELYVFVGHALVRSLQVVMGPIETSVGSAWIAVYEWLAAVMIAGADEFEVPEVVDLDELVRAAPDPVAGRRGRWWRRRRG